MRRLLLHTAAFWLMWRVQQEIPKTAALASAEFTTLRVRLLKFAARIIETASRIRVASACPDADIFRTIVLPERSPTTQIDRAQVSMVYTTSSPQRMGT